MAAFEAWRPTSGPDTAARRAERLAVVREFFAKRNVLEVDVPVLSRAATSDPNIDSLAVSAALSPGKALWLCTSPEHCMKRLLASGYPDIFSIARVFRDGELGDRHEPEFTLVEWYRRGFDLEAMATETCEFIAAVLDNSGLAESVCWRRYTDAFRAALPIDPFSATADELADAAGADNDLRSAIGDDRDAWLDLLMSTRVVNEFPEHELTVVTHYPASQAALARLDANDSSVALRFEVFLGPLELANGYVELTDAEEQRARFERECETRRAEGRAVPPSDERLLEALESGLPECAGVAVGFERLHMLFADKNAIRDVITFTFGNIHD